MSVGERLRSARQRAGLSLRDVAGQVQVSAQAIFKYERDLDMPGSAVLIRLAQALDVSVEWLLRPVDVVLSAPAYRSHRSRLQARERAALEHRVREWLERYLEAEQLVGETLTFTMPSLERNIERIEEVEEVAEALRQVWNLGEGPIADVTATLERHGIRVGFLDGPDHFDALGLMVNAGEPVMVVKQGVPGDRQRMSLAHELGHLLLLMPADWKEKAVEAAAYRFAAAFLVPLSVVRRELGHQRATLDWYELHLLKHRYGMSMQAWIHRAADAGIISPATAQDLYRRFRTQGWHVREPGDAYPPETSTRLERLVLRALGEGLITESRAAELLGRPLTVFFHEVRLQHENFPISLRA